MQIPTMRQLFSALFQFSRLTGRDKDEVRESVEKVRGAAKWFPIAEAIGKGDPADDSKITLPLRFFHDLCAAFGITDIDLILDLAASGNLGDEDTPLLVRRSERVPHYYSNQDGVVCQVVGKERWKALEADGHLNRQRTQVDLVEVPPKKKTSFSRHFGHEAITVVRGSVVFTFEGFPAHELNELDTLSFNSLIRHAVANPTNETALLIVARPMMAGVYSGQLRGQDNKLNNPGEGILQSLRIGVGLDEPAGGRRRESSLGSAIAGERSELKGPPKPAFVRARKDDVGVAAGATRADVDAVDAAKVRADGVDVLGDDDHDDAGSDRDRARAADQTDASVTGGGPIVDDAVAEVPPAQLQEREGQSTGVVEKLNPTPIPDGEIAPGGGTEAREGGAGAKDHPTAIGDAIAPDVPGLSG